MGSGLMVGGGGFVIQLRTRGQASHPQTPLGLWNF